ncbi:MAG: hypothetical protein DMF76_26080, partial [Acidobacteria bacterium]
KSRRDAMFIEKVPGRHLGSPFMGERCSVALLKELPDLNSVWCSINISPLRGFFDRLLLQAFRYINIRRLFLEVWVVS